MVFDFRALTKSNLLAICEYLDSKGVVYLAAANSAVKRVLETEVDFRREIWVDSTKHDGSGRA